MDRISRLETRIAEHKESLKADQQELSKLQAQRRSQAKAKALRRERDCKSIIGRVLLAYLRDTDGDKRDTNLRAAVLRALDAGAGERDRPVLEEFFPALKNGPSKSAPKPQAADRPPAGGEAA